MERIISLDPTKYLIVFYDDSHIVVLIGMASIVSKKQGQPELLILRVCQKVILWLFFTELDILNLEAYLFTHM